MNFNNFDPRREKKNVHGRELYCTHAAGMDITMDISNVFNNIKQVTIRSCESYLRLFYTKTIDENDILFLATQNLRLALNGIVYTGNKI